jgi:hypothetical protein
MKHFLEPYQLAKLTFSWLAEILPVTKELLKEDV